MCAVECLVCGSRQSTRFLVVESFAIRACQGCGLRFLDPQPSAAELHVLYGEGYFNRHKPGEPGYDQYLGELEGHRRTFDQRLSLLPSPTAGAALLDVGAATGVFVERARRHGWAASGVEPSAWAAAHARDTMGQPVMTGSLEDLTVEPGSLGGVTMWEVIEHLPDPREVLEHIRRLLRADGFLALSTPDAGSTVAKLLGRRWPGWKKVPEHLYHFDRPTLRRLLHETGFDVSAMTYVPLVVTRGYLLDRVRDLTGFSVPGLLPKFDRTVPIQVNPYYDLFVLARPR